MLNILAKSLIISFQYNIESVYFFIVTRYTYRFHVAAVWYLSAARLLGP